MSREIRIGGGAGYWGDSAEAARQLVVDGRIDYLICDYLAEVTMSILARMKQKNPDTGYAVDFVQMVMRPLLDEIAARGVKVVVNAGGMNVRACAAALRGIAEDQGVSLKIGTVEGDDILPLAPALRAEGVREMFTGAEIPETLVSANAYLGAFPIAAALTAGADVVITGRCVDSALTLGPLIHEFGWTPDDLDRLAAGSVAGHIIECGAQATGGNFTDWADVADGWDDMGYPVAVCRADGSFDITKPGGTGGLVSRLTVGEQMLYEIGDPAAYVLPDVVCDVTAMTLTETAPDMVRIAGVRGRPPTPHYKVSATYANGWRATALTGITGFDAVAKARHYGAALIRRAERLLEARGMAAFQAVAHHVIGAETLWGDNAGSAATDSREVVLQTEVHHAERAAVEIFSKEVTGVALSMATGRFSAGEAGRPRVTPVVSQMSFLLEKARVRPTVTVDGTEVDQAVANGPSDGAALPVEPARPETASPPKDDMVPVPLIRIAVARSGDKGNMANIGVMARSAALWPALRAGLTAEAVRTFFRHFCEGEVTRWEAPGFHALNFVLTETLGGGGTSSMHLDKQAKVYGQLLLTMTIPVPRWVADTLGD